MNSTLARQLAFTFLLPLILLAAIALSGLFGLMEVNQLTRDVAAIADIHPLSGLLSNLGILLWCASAAICLFARSVRRQGVDGREGARFLLASALLSLYLMFDDLLCIHETLAPDYLGLPEKLVFAVLGVALAAYLVVFRRMILRTNYLFLVLALGLFALSVGIDSLLATPKYILEDGLKWLGIASWCSYHAQTSRRLLLEGLPQQAPAILSGAGAGFSAVQTARPATRRTRSA